MVFSHSHIYKEDNFSEVVDDPQHGMEVEEGGLEADCEHSDEDGCCHYHLPHSACPRGGKEGVPGDEGGCG